MRIFTLFVLLLGSNLVSANWKTAAVINGSPVKLAISSNSRLSYLRNDLIRSSSDNSSMSVNGHDFALQFVAEDPALLRTRYGIDCDGVLGLDFLSMTKVVFDLHEDQVSIYPNNTVVEKVLRPPRERAQLTRISLDVESGLPFIRSIVGGKRRSLMLALEPSYVVLFSDESRGKENIEFLNDCYLGEYFVNVLPTKRAKASEQLTGTTWNGYCGLFAFASRRLVLDISSRSLFVQQADADVQVTQILSSFLRVPVGIRKGDLVLGPFPRVATRPELALSSGRRLAAIAGMPASEILGAIKAGGAKLLEMMLLLLDRTRSEYEVVIMDEFFPDMSVKVIRIRG